MGALIFFFDFGVGAQVTPSLAADYLALLHGPNADYGYLLGPDSTIGVLEGQDSRALPLKG